MSGLIPSDASALRDSLQDVVGSLDCIRRLAEKIHRVSSNPLEGKPTAEDYRALKAASPTVNGLDSSMWAELLHETHEQLSDFWLAIQSASNALTGLEPATVVALSDAFPGNWTVQCQAALDAATAWLKWTRPNRGRDADASRFLSLTAKPIPDLPPAMLKLEQRMDELFALRVQSEPDGHARKNHSKRKGAPRLARTGKETAIVKAHKKNQPHEKTARLAGVFTRDGLPDASLVKTVLNRKSEQKRRQRRKP
ncbi:MAG: hypothetical protein O3B13_01265 [Planctomycetota bacterium]|nr:hypothetical protein [Planctomycetota bacterium]